MRDLRNFAIARESAFFKIEQEADLQRHRARMLLGAGRIEEIAGACLKPSREQTFEQSVRAFEVLPEVLQQQARIDDPDAAKRREFVRKIKAGLPELTPAELQRYRSVVYGVASVVGHMPHRISLTGRSRFYNAYQDAMSVPERVVPPVQWSAQALEAGRRAGAAGTRALIYGSALAILGASLAGTLLLQSTGVRTGEDLKDGLHQAGASVAGSIRQHLPDVPFAAAPVGDACSSASMPIDQNQAGPSKLDPNFSSQSLLPDSKSWQTAQELPLRDSSTTATDAHR